MKTLGRVVLAVGAIGALVLLLLYMQGTIGADKIAPGWEALAEARTPTEGHAQRVVRRTVTSNCRWSGTVAARQQVRLAPRVMARVLNVAVREGDPVKRGATLVRLDSTDFEAKLAQARAALEAARARAVQAESEHARVAALHEAHAATDRDLEAARAQAAASSAALARARAAVAEATWFLSLTRLDAPVDGVVLEKRVEAGDLAVPGQPLLVLYVPETLRLEAAVPLAHTRALAKGATVQVEFPALGRTLEASVDEIAPGADPHTHTVTVKAALPSTGSLRPGMFGRLVLPCGTEQVLVVPAAAVRRVGQLELVRVRNREGRWRLRHVKTGRRFDETLEVLSGLEEGDEVWVP
ncbi:MAG: efflux RND transporter periplasmic adaptor subunit [Planctomycetota bacterium]|nr:MAG: efflux RND transporter periplasmic adaptor subunit [Planctomycetota bacterium]